MKKSTLFVFMMLLCSMPMMAEDFSNSFKDGKTGYFNILGGDSVELTYFMTPGGPAYDGDMVVDSVIYQPGTPTPFRVVKIGDEAFKDCSSLTSIELPSSIHTFGSKVMDNCAALDKVTIHRMIPPQAASDAFPVPSATTLPITLYVPVKAVTAYLEEANYANSFDIKGYLVEDTEVSKVTDSTATICWAKSKKAEEYTITLRKEPDDTIAQYIVDVDGVIKTTKTFMPSIYRLKRDSTVNSTDFLVITLGGLEAGTGYNYTVVGVDAEKMAVYHAEGAFTTSGEQPVEEQQAIDLITNDQMRKCENKKIIQDGQLLILRGDKTYTIQGQEMQQ